MKEITAKHKNDVHFSDLTTQICMAKSIICTILKNKESTEGTNVARGVRVLTKQGSQMM